MKENNLSEEYKEELMRNAVYVNNSIELKTAIAKKELVIISTDPELYERMLNKITKEEVSNASKLWGKILMGVGAFITVASFGLFSVIGLPIAGVGAALGVSSFFHPSEIGERPVTSNSIPFSLKAFCAICNVPLL